MHYFRFKTRHLTQPELSDITDQIDLSATHHRHNIQSLSSSQSRSRRHLWQSLPFIGKVSNKRIALFYSTL